MVSVLVTLVLFTLVPRYPASEVRFVLYRELNGDPHDLLLSDSSTIISAKFDGRVPTRFIIHGWKSSLESPDVIGIRDAYLNRGAFNVIAVEWKQKASEMYTISVDFVPHVGQEVAKVIEALMKYQHLNINNLILVGFSLGAHCAGYAGRYLSPLKIEGIVALDPAGPWFNHETTVSRKDANYVQVIHTSSGIVGYRDSIGHADFFPNFGVIQPSCFFLAMDCNHFMAYEYFIDSIDNPGQFVGQQCARLSQLDAFTCKSSLDLDCRRMGGEPLDKEARGLFFVKVEGGHFYTPFWRCGE